LASRIAGAATALALALVAGLALVAALVAGLALVAALVAGLAAPKAFAFAVPMWSGSDRQRSPGRGRRPGSYILAVVFAIVVVVRWSVLPNGPLAGALKDESPKIKKYTKM
jgi:hypothetical protein